MNYRLFDDLSVDFSSHATIICGLNGTGKSSFVVALTNLQRFLLQDSSVDGLIKPMDIPIWLQAEYGGIAVEFELELSIDDIHFNYSLVIDYKFKGNLSRVNAECIVVNGEIIFKNELGEADVVTDDHKIINFPVDWNFTGLSIAMRYNSKVKKLFNYVANHLFIIAPVPVMISDTHENANNRIVLDGSNFSAWYDSLVDDNVRAIAQAIDDLEPIIPNLRQFSLKPYGVGKKLYANVTVDNEPKSHPFNLLSDGQKVLVLYYILIRQAPQDSCIVIDEFENYLSPIELQPIYNMIQDIWEEKNIQFIIVSHHDRTLEWFKCSSILFKNEKKNGHYQVTTVPLTCSNDHICDPIEAMRS